MTAAPAPSAPAIGGAVPAGPSRLGFGGLLAAEWTKIRSVKSTLWSYLAFVVVAVGFSTLIATVIAHDWNAPGNHPNHAKLLTDPTAVIFGAGLGLGQLAICVLGVIVITSEYSSGTIRASLLAVPKRLPMLLAKIAVFGLLVVVLAEIVAFGSFFVGSAIQTAMPSIATSIGGASGGTAYGVLLFANGLGGVLGGLLLEGTGWLRLSVRAALVSTAVYGVTSALFAFSHDFVVAALLLVVGGVANLAAMSITQTVVQMLAPREKRGQIVGLYGVGANGMRLGSGFTVGIFGAIVGLRVSLGLSALALCAGTAIVAAYLWLGSRRAAAAAVAAQAVAAQAGPAVEAEAEAS